jgi:YD repeat-containing protein
MKDLSVAKLDITTLTRAADELLARVENPRHRRILTNYRRHALLEVTGRWERIFVPEMTVDHPVCYLNINRTSATLDGLEEVTAFYRTLLGSGTNVIVLEDEQLAVADWGLATEATFNSYARGHVIPYGDPDGHYLVRQRIAMHWTYDPHGRLVGVHVYEHCDLTDVRPIPVEDFITVGEARERLDPLIRPLPTWPPTAQP